MIDQEDQQELDVFRSLSEELWARFLSDASTTYDSSSDESMIDFAERQMGTRLRGSPKLKALFIEIVMKMRRRETIRLAIIGPRGGGKTQLVATLQVVAWMFFDYDVSNVGGSLKQAQLCYQYVLDGYSRSEDIRAHFARAPSMNRSRSVRGRTMFINAASDKSLRGPHPGGESHGGMLTIDESAIMSTSMVTAALFQVSSANPSAVIQLSTMGEAEGGYFYDIVTSTNHRGYELRSFDAFDVSSRCPYDCATTCPVPEHFAQDYYQGHGEAKDLVHKALCGGRAHETSGHMQIDEIALLFRESDLETFLREMMGVRGSTVGKVFSHETIDAATVESVDLSDVPRQAQERFVLMDKAVGLDWGWAGMTAAVYVVRLRGTLVVYRWEMWDHTSFSKIRGHLLSNAVAERIETICPDAAEPSDNADLQEEAERATERDARPKDDGYSESATPDDALDVRVMPVVFSQWKRRGYGAARRRMEKGQILFPRVFNGLPVEGVDRAIGLLKGHRKGADGQPEKREDHVSDALICAVLAFERPFMEAGRIAR